MNDNRRTLLAGALSSTLLTLCPSAFAQREAQPFPNRPVRLIVPYPAGGFTDIMARYYGDKLSQKWGQPVIVDNRAGASGVIGSNAVAKAAPDGHTLLVGLASLTSTPGVMASMPFDVVKDFAPITILSNTQTLYVVKADSPILTLAELVATAKAKPGSITYSTGGIGTAGHLQMALLEAQTGAAFVHVPYRGSPATLMAAVTGEVATAVTSVTTAAPLLAAKKIRALAIGSDKRSAILPNVPTLTEAGVPGVLSVDGWVGLLAPAGTPKAIVDRIYQDVISIMETRQTDELLERSALEKLPTTPDQFAHRIQTEVRELTKIAKAKKIVAE